jgi:putative hydrolase of the HAD superfamily
MIHRITEKSRFFYGVALFVVCLFAVYTFSKEKNGSKRAKNGSYQLLHDNNGITSIAWDLHDVLFFGKPSLLRSIWNYPSKRSLIPHKELRSILWQGMRGKKELNSAKIIAAARKYNTPELANFIIQHESSCAPDPEMMEFIKKLDEQGFKQYICSNISFQALEVLKQRYPDFFSHFEGTYTTLESNSRKPHISFFTSFLNKYNLKAEEVLFVDDKLGNCTSAKRVGMHAYCFKGNDKKKREKSIKDIHLILSKKESDAHATPARV